MKEGNRAMRIDRRELLRQFGGAAGAAALLPSMAETADPSAESATRLVHLDRNESAHGPCEKAKTAFRDAVMEANRYPDTDVKSLCAAVATLHHVQAENITLGCGSTELLRMAAESYLGPGKSLITASPTHEAIALAARLLGAEVRSVPLPAFTAMTWTPCWQKPTVPPALSTSAIPITPPEHSLQRPTSKRCFLNCRLAFRRSLMRPITTTWRPATATPPLRHAPPPIRD